MPGWNRRRRRVTRAPILTHITPLRSLYDYSPSAVVAVITPKSHKNLIDNLLLDDVSTPESSPHVNDGKINVH